jgi:invasion protein IalB
MRYIAALLVLLGAVPASAATPAPETPAMTTQSARVGISGWRLECDPTNTSALACHVLNSIVQSPNGGLVISFTFSPAAEDKTILTMQVPLGVSVRTPIGVSVGSSPSQNFAFLFCSQQGCYATGTINSDLLAAMKAGKGELRASYGILDNNLAEHGIAASLPLTGFADVYARLK